MNTLYIILSSASIIIMLIHLYFAWSSPVNFKWGWITATIVIALEIMQYGITHSLGTLFLIFIWTVNSLLYYSIYNKQKK